MKSQNQTARYDKHKCYTVFHYQSLSLHILAPKHKISDLKDTILGVVLTSRLRLLLSNNPGIPRIESELSYDVMSTSSRKGTYYIISGFNFYSQIDYQPLCTSIYVRMSIQQEPLGYVYTRANVTGYKTYTSDPKETIL